MKITSKAKETLGGFILTIFFIQNCEEKALILVKEGFWLSLQ